MSKTKNNIETGPDIENAEATLLTEFDLYLFKEGKHFHLYKKLGSHAMTHQGRKGTYFALWAPNAAYISVIGDFNGWDRGSNPMNVRHDESGIWEVFIPDVGSGSVYKYFIKSHNGYEVEKGDPYALMWETPPNTASVVWEGDYKWKDKTWLAERALAAGKAKPYSVYEMHVGSWKRVPEEENRSLSYKEMAETLPGYLKEMGFTHVEFMPVMEHPFFGSWGYQVTGYFAPSSRFGTPDEFMYLIDVLHQEGIGVILDWVPSHFPSDMHGLHYFDGTFLYEHEDPRKGYHPDWKSYIFNYGRNEVKSFLISNALFWLDRFHVDGLRVDAVASMLYLNYSREEGQWEPNEFGGQENLEAIRFIKEFNETVYKEYPDVVTIAEESTAFPKVSRPTYDDGLGFGMKWMMGWMHDTIKYFEMEPIHRQHHQGTVTFSLYYAFTENFMLPFSHDEVVYGKKPMILKMPGDEWQKFANLRAMYAYMYAHPGNKLLFMGGEFGQTTEWNHDSSLDWHYSDLHYHRGVFKTVQKLNNIFKDEPALFEYNFEERGFEWIDIQDTASSVISFLRKGENSENDILVVCNFTPVHRQNYRIGVPASGKWREIFNSDIEEFGGSNQRNAETIDADEYAMHGKEHSISLNLSPLAVHYFKRDTPPKELKSTAKKAVKDVAKDAKEIAEETVKPVKKTAKKVATEAKEIAEETLKPAKKKVEKEVKKVASDAKEVAEDTLKLAKNKAENKAKKITSEAKEIAEDTLKPAKKKAENKVKKVASDAKEIAEDIVKPVTKGKADIKVTQLAKKAKVKAKDSSKPISKEEAESKFIADKPVKKKK